ncbi:hypothetical protein [Halobaculum sp. P14]|uniref:hypothetical protein n=1 Tax=Halobaculum sp. P14 TaxID=3421638 RepID=UPI003EBD69EA
MDGDSAMAVDAEAVRLRFAALAAVAALVFAPLVVLVYVWQPAALPRWWWTGYVAYAVAVMVAGRLAVDRVT